MKECYVQFIKRATRGSGTAERWADGSEPVYCNQWDCAFGDRVETDVSGVMVRCMVAPALRIDGYGTSCETYAPKWSGP